MYYSTTVTVSDFTEEMFYKMQSVEPERIMEYCCTTINESASESAKNVSNGVKTIFAKILANVFEDGESGQNPLMIDLVVGNILKNLCPSDLLSCRQVCSLWNTIASSIFRKSQRIIFYPESIGKLIAFTSFAKRDASILKTNYEGPPFKTYCFTCQNHPCYQFPNQVMADFISNCGQYVRSLELFFPDDAYLSSTDFVAFFIKGMPNLEKIHFINLPRNLTQFGFLEDRNYSSRSLLSAVTHLRIDRTWNIEDCWIKEFLQDLFSLMPNLEDYEVWTWNSTSEDDHSEPYFHSLSQRNVESIKVLRPGSIGDKLCYTIVSLGFKLSKLYLPVLNRNICPETIEELLQSQKNTLQELQLNCSTMQDSKNKRFLKFPKMGKLISLYVIITHPWNNDYTSLVPEIDYNAQFPIIKKLRIELGVYNDGNFINYFFPKQCIPNPCKTMEELNLSFSGFRDDKFISILSQIFPCLKILSLDGYGSRVFRSIFTFMGNLECLELNLIYGFGVDDQMTGLEKDQVTTLKKKGESKLKEKHVQMKEKSLCSLSRLRSLVIKQKDYIRKMTPEAQCISFVTVYLALARMKQLRRLEIQSVKFSEECKHHLEKELEDCWILMED